MAIFQPITLSWGGRDYTVPADRVMGAIGVIEDVVTFPELVGSLQSSRPNMSKLARAYGAVLRYAGAAITDEEIYVGMFTPGKIQEQIATAINALMVMMTPPGALVGAASEGNLPAAKAARSGSSKRSTRRP